MFQLRLFSTVMILALAAPAVSLSQITSQLDFAVYATGTGCGAINISGNAFVDSFDSSKGTYTQTKQLNDGIIGVSGNLTLSSNAVIDGPVFALNTGTGACVNGAPGITLAGQAKATGGYFQLSAVPPFPNPPTVTPGSQNYNLSANTALAPGSYATSP